MNFIIKKKNFKKDIWTKKGSEPMLEKSQNQMILKILLKYPDV